MIAETLAAISTTMQAIDFWEKHGGTRDSVITQLNLRYEPERFRQVEEQLRAEEPSQVDFYESVFKAIRKRADQCRDRFVDSVGDEEILPQERKTLSRAGRLCVCQSIKAAKDFAPKKRLPAQLEDLWREFECSRLFDDGDDGGRGGGFPPVASSGSAGVKEPQPA